MSAVLLERKFYVQRCTTPACRGVLTVDGQDYGILGLADAGKLAAKAPSLAAFLASHAGEVHAAHGYPPYVQLLVARMLHVAQAAYQERSVPRPDGEERRQRECDNRVLLDGTVQMGSTRPEQWTLEESFLRTGVWCPGSATKDNWEASGLGGSHVQRRLRAYTADFKSQGSSKEQSCTKHKQASHKQACARLVAGLVCALPQVQVPEPHG
jgi:hypothetical protein